MNPTIYLDHNATTPLDPEVRAEMDACLDRAPGNPGGIHAPGQEARRVLDRARLRAARLIGAQPNEIVFTSGGTEADNLAILGAVAAARREQAHVITTRSEHQAVLNCCRHLADTGVAVTYLAVGSDGELDPAAVAAALTDSTVLVSVMLANNEVGTLQPVAALAPLARARAALFHTDAVQAVGKIPVDVTALGVDLLAFSSHKIQGPLGVGALYVRPGTRLSPLLFGGHQERGLRPGTENVVAIAGFGKACELAARRLAEDCHRLETLRTRFENTVIEQIPGSRVNGNHAPRLANTSSITFPGIEGEMLAINLDLLGLAVSTGAACSTADRTPSHVLLAMGRTPEEARSTIRFSFGRTNTETEAVAAVDRVRQAVANLGGCR